MTHYGYAPFCLACPLALLCIGLAPDQVSQCGGCKEIWLSREYGFHVGRRIATANLVHMVETVLPQLCPAADSDIFHKCVGKDRRW